MISRYEDMMFMLEQGQPLDDILYQYCPGKRLNEVRRDLESLKLGMADGVAHMKEFDLNFYETAQEQLESFTVRHHRSTSREEIERLVEEQGRMAAGEAIAHMIDEYDGVQKRVMMHEEPEEAALVAAASMYVGLQGLLPNGMLPQLVGYCVGLRTQAYQQMEPILTEEDQELIAKVIEGVVLILIALVLLAMIWGTMEGYGALILLDQVAQSNALTYGITMVMGICDMVITAGGTALMYTVYQKLEEQLREHKLPQLDNWLRRRKSGQLAQVCVQEILEYA
ncbi:MAG: hypothetical protein IJ315_01325 [Firmicutes bacterium]|nr:hypothetical protein [Bacillota bacterium]